MSQLAPVFPTQDIQQMKSIYNCAVFTRKTISLRQLIAFSRDQMICVTQRMEIRVGSKVTPSNTWVKDAAFVQWNMHNCRLFKFCLHFLCEASLHFFYCCLLYHCSYCIIMCSLTFTGLSMVSVHHGRAVYTYIRTCLCCMFLGRFD